MLLLKMLCFKLPTLRRRVREGYFGSEQIDLKQNMIKL